VHIDKQSERHLCVPFGSLNNAHLTRTVGAVNEVVSRETLTAKATVCVHTAVLTPTIVHCTFVNICMKVQAESVSQV